MNKIVPMYQFDMILVWFLARVRGGATCNDIKIVYISIFSQIRSKGGGGRQISMFSQIQNSPHYPRGGGGQENYGLFPQFVTFFFVNAPLTSWRDLLIQLVNPYIKL